MRAKKRKLTLAMMLVIAPVSYLMFANPLTAQPEAAAPQEGVDAELSPEELKRQEEAARQKEEEARRRAEEARKREAEARFRSALDKAGSFKEQGDFLEARNAYEEMLSRDDLTPGQQAEVVNRFAEANFELILSPQEMPESTLHVVERGDSLYKIARDYATTIDLIRKSNELAGDLIFPGQELKVITGSFTIQVDKTSNELFLYLDEKPVKRYPVATGKDDSTPEGEFKIVTKLEDPVWYYAGAVVPPDSPENILGTRWLGFDKSGYGIHGTTMPETIGKHESLGCIRMHNEDVEELYAFVPRGTVVTVR